MEKKTKILIGCIIAFAFLCFLIAFLITNPVAVAAPATANAFAVFLRIGTAICGEGGDHE